MSVHSFGNARNHRRETWQLKNLAPCKVMSSLPCFKFHAGLLVLKMCKRKLDSYNLL